MAPDSLFSIAAVNISRNNAGNRSHILVVLLDALDSPHQQLIALGVFAHLGDQLLGGDGGDSCCRAIELCLHNTIPVDVVLHRHRLLLSIYKTPAAHQNVISLLVLCEKNLL